MTIPFLDYEKAWAALRKEPIQRGALWRAGILSNQANTLLTAVMYSQYYKDSKSHREVKGQILEAVGAVITQIFIFCESQRIRFEKAEEAGWNNLMDFINTRMKSKI